MVWHNADGLYTRFGVEEANVALGGEYNVIDRHHVYEFEIDLTTLGDSSDPTFIADTVRLPWGAMVEKVEVIVREVTAGTNSNLNLGTYKLDRTTAIDADGYLAAADAWHTAAIGTITEYVVGTAEAGADIGQVLTEAEGPALLVAFYDTGAFTDGVLGIRIFWSMTDPDML